MINNILIGLCFIVDQFAKHKAEDKLQNNKVNIFNNKINLSLVYNKGAFLGILKNKKSILILLNIIGMVLMIGFYISFYFEKGLLLIKTGIALMIGGGLSNTYDRIIRKKVVDYFSFSIKPKLYFNLADIFVFIGCILVFIGSSIIKRI